jgi:hypothetical protein
MTSKNLKFLTENPDNSDELFTIGMYCLPSYTTRTRYNKIRLMLIISTPVFCELSTICGLSPKKHWKNIKNLFTICGLSLENIGKCCNVAFSSLYVDWFLNSLNFW